MWTGPLRAFRVAAAVASFLVLAPVAQASEPLEGVWDWSGAKVQVASDGAGALHGVVVEGTPSAEPCAVPGTVLWSGIRGATTSWSGAARRWDGQCAPEPDAGASWTLTPDYWVATYCPSAGGGCSTMVRDPATPPPAPTPPPTPTPTPTPLPPALPPFDPCVAYPASCAPRQPVLYASARGASEGDGTARITFYVEDQGDATVSFTATLRPGTAQPRTDYLDPGPQRLTIAPGSETTTLDVTLVDDRVSESRETFDVVISDASGATASGRPATVRITDDDAAQKGRGRGDDGGRGEREVGRLVPCWKGSGSTLSAAAAVVLQRAGKCPKVSRRSRGGSAGTDTMRGSGRADALFGLGGNDRLLGSGGADRLLGGRGNDTLMGDSGNDQLDGGDGDDRVLGGAGDDLIVEGRFGDDALDGGAGDDVILGHHGGDRIKGGPGNDLISGGSGPDTVDCGPGRDTLYYNLSSDRSRSRGCEVFVEEEDVDQQSCDSGGTSRGELVIGTAGADRNCHAGGGGDFVEGAGGSDELFGDGGDDELFGRFGNDVLWGGAGNDLLEGGRGDDTMNGGPGKDELIGGYGRDRLKGGPGNDILNPGWGERGEVVDCGPGFDTLIHGPGDRGINCERTKKP